MWNRRSFIKSVTAGSLLMSSGVASGNVLSNKTKITLLHTNDIHSRIDPFPTNDKYNAGKGGVANLASLINYVRTHEQNIVLLDAGDQFQGTPYFNRYSGEVEMKLLSHLGYDAITIGNHEFDKGVDNLLTQYNKVDLSVLSANYIFPENWNDRVEKFKILEKGGIKIGVFGIGIDPEGLIAEKNFKGVRFLDPLKTASEMSDFLSVEKKCDLVVALTHHGVDKDIAMGKAIANIDIIIGGHSHTYLKDPMVIENKYGQRVIISQAGYGGLYLGRIDIWFDKNGKHF